MFENKINLVDQMLVNTKFNGTVLIAHQSDILLSKAYGFADFELDVPMQVQTKLRIASITKMITAVAILQLIEKKTLNLEDRLIQFFPDYPNGEQITIYQLLTHTSGISNFELEADFYEVEHATSFSEKLIDLFKHEPLRFTPGTDYEYSVSGYLLLSYIIEKVTGFTYEQYLKKHIFEPLKMGNSGLDFYRPIIKGRAKTYEVEKGQIRNGDFFDMRIAGGGGGLYSTAEDLFLFQRGLLNHQILTKESFDLMNTNQVVINEQTHYGFGLFLAQAEICGKDRHKNYHTGGGPGVRSILAYYPEDELLCIIITNINDRNNFNDAHSKMEDILLS
ncbi:MAG: beta-lactamase family protein [Firmicutes bacterium]|nr:beta-lactamase family protein [Bacillota bacterium]